jgi:hypothetical protein
MTLDTLATPLATKYNESSIYADKGQRLNYQCRNPCHMCKYALEIDEHRDRLPFCFIIVLLIFL